MWGGDGSRRVRKGRVLKSKREGYELRKGHIFTLMTFKNYDSWKRKLRDDVML